MESRRLRLLVLTSSLLGRKTTWDEAENTKKYPSHPFIEDFEENPTNAHI